MKIRGRQAELGLSREDLARRSGLSITTISAIRSGRGVTTDSLEKAAAALELTMSELFDPPNTEHIAAASR